MVGKTESVSNALSLQQLRDRGGSAYIFSIITPPRKLAEGKIKERGSNNQGRYGARTPHLQMTGTTKSGSPKIKQRLSPSTASSPDQSSVPSIAYAGAKFSDPPSPNALPKPPPHWMSSQVQKSSTQCSEISHQLKLLLNVKA